MLHTCLLRDIDNWPSWDTRHLVAWCIGACLLQGIRWIMNREEEHGLTIIQQSQKGYIDKVIQCIENGKPLLIENLPDDIDAVLDPVVGKMTMKRGQNLVVKIGDSEVDYDRNFRLYLQTKLSNPHYKPEIHAQVQQSFCRCLVFSLVNLQGHVISVTVSAVLNPWFWYSSAS